MALFKGDVLIAGTNPSGGGGAGGGHVIQDSTGEEFEQRPALQFIGADVVDDDTNEATQVITPSFREIQGDIPDTNLVCLDGIPIGGIIPYGASIDTLSEDWLPCLGQAVSRTFYHELFDKYGTTYGAGDGSTTFNVPNYGGRIPVGLDENDTSFDTLGEIGGSKDMQSHSHGEYVNNGSGSRYPYTIANGGGSSMTGNWISNNTVFSNYTGPQVQTSTEGTGTSGNLQPYIVANYIVKAKTSSHTITTSNVMTVHNESDENTYSTNYINDKFSGIQMDILWTRTKGTFAAQTVALDLSDYDITLIEFNTYTGHDIYISKAILTKNVYYGVTDDFYYNNTYFRGLRNVKVLNDGVQFGAGQNEAKSTDNSWYNPTKIIGIKLH